MIVAKDEELIAYIGLGLVVPYDFREDDNTPIDLSGKTCTCVMRNIHSEFKDEGIIENFGVVTIEPEGEVGRLLLELSASDTAKFKIPSTEDSPYIISDIYSKIIVKDENDLPLLDISVRPVKV